MWGKLIISCLILMLFKMLFPTYYGGVFAVITILAVYKWIDKE